MPKKRNRRSNSANRKSSAVKPGILVLLIFAMGLLMIWKSNEVKDNYSKTKKLEKAKSDLIAEISEYKAELLDLKSIGRAEKFAWKNGLTQNVADRFTIEIPGELNSKYDKSRLLDMDQFADWLEDAGFKSGRIDAREINKAEPKKESKR